MTTLLHHRAPRLFGAKRKWDLRSIDIGLGPNKLKTAYFIGSGRFSNVFAVKDMAYIYTLYNDHSKDILTHAKQRLDSFNPHVPKISYLGIIPGPNWAPWDIKVYKSFMYQTHARKEDMPRESWEIRKTLARAHNMTAGEIAGEHTHGPSWPRVFNERFIELVRPDVPVKITEALEEIALSCTYWGEHYLFDNFTPRNMGLDHKGRLVFIDAVFDSEIIREDFIRRYKDSKR